MQNKKAQAAIGISSLKDFAVYFVIIGITLTIGARIMANVRDEMVQNTTEYNASQKTLLALDEFSDWLKILAIALVASIILVVIMAAFGK